MSSNSPWKTGGVSRRRKSIVWPSAGQVLRQLFIVGLIVGVWGALLFGFLRLTNSSQTEALAAEPSPVATVAPTPAPTATSTTVSDTPTPAASAPVASLTVEPTTQPTETPTPLPAPTDTPTPSPTEEPAPAENDTAAVSFQNDVLPILERRCVKCHGGVNDGEERIEEGLKLLSYEDVLKGSFNGPVIEPRDVENSYLIEQIVEGEMPKKEPDLLPAEIRTITAWVEAGAPDN